VGGTAVGGAAVGGTAVGGTAVGGGGSVGAAVGVAAGAQAESSAKMVTNTNAICKILETLWDMFLLLKSFKVKKFTDVTQ
jgi:hypothetical protein